MTRFLTFLILASAICVQGQDVRIEKTGESPVEAKFLPGGRVRMDLCNSGMDVIGTDDPVVRVSYHPGRGDVRVRINASGDRADIRITGCPHGNFRAKIEIPKSTGIYIRMMAGQLDVSDVTGDKDVELTFGQLNLNVGKAEDYGHVETSVSSGAIDADAWDVHKGGLFRSFDHDGPGHYRLHAHIGAGQMEIR